MRKQAYHGREQRGSMTASDGRIYTKIGDQGKTTFFGCGLIAKNDPRIEALGAFDELNSYIGIALCFVDDKRLAELLNKLQHELFQLGADLVGSRLNPESMPRINQAHVQEIESVIDEFEARLGMPKKFILPGGTKASALLHLCRVVARRAERCLVGVKDTLQISPEMLRYVNRLSDLFYVMARHANKEVDVKEQQPIYKYISGASDGR